MKTFSELIEKSYAYQQEKRFSYNESVHVRKKETNNDVIDERKVEENIVNTENEIPNGTNIGWK